MRGSVCVCACVHVCVCVCKCVWLSWRLGDGGIVRGY